jgi:ribose-phosphate pyrophosphokinase
MMIEIIQKTDIKLKMIEFPGGEVHVTIEEGHFDQIVTVRAQITNSAELMKLVMVSELMDEQDVLDKTLLLHYIPYARQDRRCAPGDAFSLKPFTKILNSLEFDLVEVTDPHSNVAPALIDKVHIQSMTDIVKSSFELTNLVKTTRAVSPDAGAEKKVEELCRTHDRPNTKIKADKIRDPLTGHITDTVINVEELTGARVTIWDDICDGGRTFIELAKVLKAAGAVEINLFVTHGIFSKGYEALINGDIDHIYTTDSLPQEHHDTTGIEEIVTVICV